MADHWRDVAKRVRNWGKWGPHDQLGTLNYITPEKVLRAAGIVRKGRTIPLSIPIDAYGPQGAHGFRRNPIHIMSVDGGDQDAARHLEGWGGSTDIDAGNVTFCCPPLLMMPFLSPIHYCQRF